MQRFQQPSAFPYHQHTAYTPPTTCISPYSNTSHRSSISTSTSTLSATPTTSTSITTRGYTTYPEPGSFTSDHLLHSSPNPYSQTDHREPHSEQQRCVAGDITCPQNNFTGIGEQFADQPRYADYEYKYQTSSFHSDGEVDGEM